jgi:hypothetical protein
VRKLCVQPFVLHVLCNVSDFGAILLDVIENSPERP